MYRCEVSIPLKSENAHIVSDVLGPEVIGTLDDRAKTNLGQLADSVRLDICAQDIPSLRSALNSYLRYIKLSLDMLEVKQNE